ncbi:MAG: TRAP transporter large permease subunit [Spirochaetaceae bacterium]|nr:TRAP transporter large permease subunit [Spirochaetaceae bacterium]
MKFAVLAIALVMYGLVIAFSDKKAWFTLGAAAIVIALGVVSPAKAAFELVNWNVLLIYIGSLIIADLFIYSRVPAHIADRIVDSSPTLGLGIVFILIMTGIISAFVENVATVLVMAPIAIALSKKVGMKPTVFMIGLAVMANLQGTATLVGDPPSMIFASFANYSFNDFFVHQGKLSIFFAVQAGAIAGAIYFYFYFRKYGKTNVQLAVEKVVSYLPSALLIALILGLAAISFFFEGLALSGLWCMILAVVGLFWYVFVRKEPVKEAVRLVKGLDWETIFFLIGIFVVIGAISEVGLLDDLAIFLQGVIGGNMLLGFVIIVAISVLLSGFIDNVPYIIVMLPVAASLASSLNLPKELYMFGLLIGSCLGGNLTPFGASANVVAVGICKKEGANVSFGEWVKIAGPFTLITTVASALFVWFGWR